MELISSILPFGYKSKWEKLDPQLTVWTSNLVGKRCMILIVYILSSQRE